MGGIVSDVKSSRRIRPGEICCLCVLKRRVTNTASKIVRREIIKADVVDLDLYNAAKGDYLAHSGMT